MPDRPAAHRAPLLLRRTALRIVIPVLVAFQALAVGLVLPGLPAALAADLFTELRTFPGVVLVPVPGLGPFEALEPWRVELNRPRPGSTAIVRGRYLIQYRDPLGGAGSAQIGGSMGREELNQTLTTLAVRSFRRCAADAAYCFENVGGQDGAMPASEVFRGLMVNDEPAVAEHVVCCGGHFWSLTWYDATRDMTYTLVLVGPTADAYGGGIAAENEHAAQAIAEIAGQLAPLE
ncbi:MAG TPA: hypothetical protein VFH48_14435 [Chloroflexota bacterium]|nr:hypothetical protein [Chloroflexota bacterium]